MVELGTIARGLAARAGVKPAPLALVFEITHLCNLACDYCDRHTPLPRELSREQIFTALDQFHAIGMRYLSLDGGEPLAHKHVAEVVDRMRAKGVAVYMNTNGILVPRKIDVIRKLAKVKISLDGPRKAHDAMRGAGSFDKAIAGAQAVRMAGVPVEMTCVVGTHNQDVIDELIDFAERLKLQIVFQPARNSLFLDTDRDGKSFQLDDLALRAVFARVEARKKTSTAIGNAWSSLRHFRRFPEDIDLPCAAGWITATMDPEGHLYHCGQVNRGDKISVVTLGAEEAFRRLPREGCPQCWCARVVEANYAWGGRVDTMVPPRATAAPPPVPKRRRLAVLG